MSKEDETGDDDHDDDDDDRENNKVDLPRLQGIENPVKTRKATRLAMHGRLREYQRGRTEKLPP